MDFSKLSYAQVEDMAAQLNTSSQGMQTVLEEVKTLFNKVGNDDVWSGNAASETKAKFDQLSAKFPEFVQAIEDCYKYLMQVAANYRAVDAKIQGN